MKTISATTITRAAPEKGGTRARGFTLLELMLVLGIAVLIASVTVVSYFGLRHGLAVGAATRQVDAVFRLARNSAVRRQETSILRWANVQREALTRPVGEIYTEVARRVGLWHFEEVNSAANEFLGMFAFGPRLYGTLWLSDQAARLLPGGVDIADAHTEGYLGRAVLFSSSPSYLQCGLYRSDLGWVPNPAFRNVYGLGADRVDNQGVGDDTGGFVISVRCLPLEQTRSDGTSGLQGVIASRYADIVQTAPGPHVGYLLELLPSGGLYAYVRIVKAGVAVREERAATADFRLSPRRWSKIEMRWRAGRPLGQQIELLADGVDRTVRLTADTPGASLSIPVTGTGGFAETGQISVMDTTGTERIIAYTMKTTRAFYAPAARPFDLAKDTSVVPAAYTDSCPEPIAASDRDFLYVNVPPTSDTTRGQFLGLMDEFEFKHLFVSEPYRLSNALRFGMAGSLQIDSQGRVPEAVATGSTFIILLDNALKAVVGGSSPILPGSVGPLPAAGAKKFPPSGLVAVGTEDETDGIFTIKELIQYQRTGGDAVTHEGQFLGLSRNYRGATNNLFQNIIPGDAIYRAILVSVSSLAAPGLDDGSA